VNVGGVKSLLWVVKAGRFGVDVKPVAMINFLALYDAPGSVSTIQSLPALVTRCALLPNIIRSLMVFPEKSLC
jgi:hypothetical protein